MKSVRMFVIAALTLPISVAFAQSNRPFVDPEFDVPAQLEVADMRLRMLTVNDVVKDYDAVMSSAAQLNTVWPGTEWPDGLTLEQNLIDLGWHQKEFERQSSFAYTVVTPDERQVIGCVYIDPTLKTGFDAEVYLWAREAELGSAADARLYSVVREWLADDWPFENVAFPGREISWEKWAAIPDEKR